MATEVNAYDTVLQDLYQQRDKIEAAIAAIMAIKPSAAGQNQKPSRASHAQPVVAGNGRFSGMTIIDAAISVLKERNAATHVSEITKEILHGGMSIAGDASNTVGSILTRRAKERGDVKRVGRGTWATEHYAMTLDDLKKHAEPDADEPGFRAAGDIDILG